MVHVTVLPITGLGTLCLYARHVAVVSHEPWTWHHRWRTSKKHWNSSSTLTLGLFLKILNNRFNNFMSLHSNDTQKMRIHHQKLLANIYSADSCYSQLTHRHACLVEGAYVFTRKRGISHCQTDFWLISWENKGSGTLKTIMPNPSFLQHLPLGRVGTPHTHKIVWWSCLKQIWATLL